MTETCVREVFQEFPQIEYILGEAGSGPPAAEAPVAIYCLPR